MTLLSEVVVSFSALCYREPRDTFAAEILEFGISLLQA